MVWRGVGVLTVPNEQDQGLDSVCAPGRCDCGGQLEEGEWGAIRSMRIVDWGGYSEKRRYD